MDSGDEGKSLVSMGRGAWRTQRVGRGGRSEVELSIAADIVEGIVEEGKDREDSLAQWKTSALSAG